MKLITVHLPEEFLTGLAELVRSKRYPNRSEAIRNAIRDLLKEELWPRSGNTR
ncbi:MAG: ribbon-helix-helix domain-containing protein [Candidatus Hodarchaeota archaeon]